MFEPKPKGSGADAAPPLVVDVPAVDLVCREQMVDVRQAMCVSPVPKTPGGSKSPSPDLGSKRTRARVQQMEASDDSDEEGAQSQISIV